MQTIDEVIWLRMFWKKKKNNHEENHCFSFFSFWWSALKKMKMLIIEKNNNRNSFNLVSSIKCYKIYVPNIFWRSFFTNVNVLSVVLLHLIAVFIITLRVDILFDCESKQQERRIKVSLPIKVEFTSHTLGVHITLI